MSKHKPIVAIIRDPECKICLGTGAIRNPLHRPKEWKRLERMAQTLVQSITKNAMRNITHVLVSKTNEKFPWNRTERKGARRFRKIRNLARRYQSIKPCPRCIKRRQPTALEIGRKLLVEPLDVLFPTLEDLERRGLLTWHWPDKRETLLTIAAFKEVRLEKIPTFSNWSKRENNYSRTAFENLTSVLKQTGDEKPQGEW